MSKIIGRLEECKLLSDLLHSGRAEFVALYGRRRIGKTYLIRNFFSQSACQFFHVTGIQDAALSVQLEQFVKEIGETFYQGAQLALNSRWIDAFDSLTKAIHLAPKSKKVVIFLDELPWLATKRSGLLQALDYYWNRYWVHDHRLKLIVCGSSATWIIDNIINSKGGLYNRLTHSLKLEPFTLSETKSFLEYKGVRLNNRHILDLYMVIGGVPHYLSQLRKGISASQAIDELCFQKKGILFGEFDRLFASLFNESETYLKICRVISQYRYGIGQAQLLKETESSIGGRSIKKIKELEEAGFIMSFIPHGHQEKGIYYKLIDEYTLFYFHWIEPNLSAIRKRDQTVGYWLSKSKMPRWKIWAGYAFEAVCYKHLANIRKKLEIDPGAEVGSWRYVPKKDPESGESQTGTQIDLLFDRPDNAITLCEIKYNDQPFVIDKVYAQVLQNKEKIYVSRTKTHKQIFLTMITSGGLKPSLYSEEMVSQEVSLDDLFGG